MGALRYPPHPQTLSGPLDLTRWSTDRLWISTSWCTQMNCSLTDNQQKACCWYRGSGPTNSYPPSPSPSSRPQVGGHWWKGTEEPVREQQTGSGRLCCPQNTERRRQDATVLLPISMQEREGRVDECTWRANHDPPPPHPRLYRTSSHWPVFHDIWTPPEPPEPSALTGSNGEQNQHIEEATDLWPHGLTATNPTHSLTIY